MGFKVLLNSYRFQGGFNRVLKKNQWRFTASSVRRMSAISARRYWGSSVASAARSALSVLCATLNVIIWSCGLFEGKGVSTSRVSPPGPLSVSSYGHVGCLKARAFPPPV
jgi:hypothetical protein